MARKSFMAWKKPSATSVGADVEGYWSDRQPMTYPHRPNGQPSHLSADLAKPWVVTRPNRSVGLTRRYEVTWVDASGNKVASTRVAPAAPAFEAAFSAFARGTLVATPGGPVAVEDLQPGALVSTRQGPQPVRWIGRILLPPANLQQDSGPDVFRLTGDCFGPNRPSPDLVLCSGARLVRRVAGLAGGEALLPVAGLADGETVTRIAPMSAVQSYHLALDRHSVIEVNGLSVESFHPGRETLDALSGDQQRLYLSLFPWVDGFAGFGPQVLPRTAVDQIDSLGVA